ncbi:MAG: chorismate synthase [Ignavibacteriaceae bacterium]
MIRYLTAGESHGKALVTIIDGFPSNFNLSENFINLELKRRQSGYGRGGRMKIESDHSEILSGVRFGKTIGSPVSVLIKNNDWVNWEKSMQIDVTTDQVEKVSIPRPGHADLTGTLKYNFDDIRNSIERSSARETAARVAAGAVAKCFLENFNISVGSYVESIGGIYPETNFLAKLLLNKLSLRFNAAQLNRKADKSKVRVLDSVQENKIINAIRKAKKNGDTLGGTFIVVATGLPVGLGSFVQSDRRIDADLASAVMSINAVKAVEIGSGFSAAESKGSLVHDEIILRNEKFLRSANRAGGIEGGITTGMPIIIRGAMKPISTLMKPLKSVDLKSMKKIQSRRERSDFVAVPSCAVIAESAVAWIIAKHLLLKFGGDSIEETMENFNNYNSSIFTRIKSNFNSP